MRKALRSFFLIGSILMFGLSVSSVLKHWDYKETLQDLSGLLQASVNKAALIKESLNNLVEFCEFTRHQVLGVFFENGRSLRKKLQQRN